MTAGDVSNAFLKKLKEKRRLLAEEEAKNSPAADLFAEFIPDVDDTGVVELSPQEKTLDEFIRRIPITEAYQKWGGTSPINGHRREHKVSCPNPAHEDKKPTFSMNTEKNVFMCFKCGGGDLWDIAAWHFGYPVPGYKSDPATFRLLRDRMVLDYGIVLEKGIAGDTFLTRTESEPGTAGVSGTAEHAGGSSESNTTAEISYTPEGSAYKEDEEPTRIRVYPDIKWRELVKPDTFLWEYLQATTIDDVPEEYHFWCGLLAVGMAVGRNRVLDDSPQVNPNLFLCISGDTGTGKSKAKRHLVAVVKGALPYKRDDQPPYGARVLRGSQSGEVIIKSFIHPIVDAGGKILGNWAGVKGLIDFEELSEVIGKSRRQGSTLKTTIMDLYDAPMTIASASMLHGEVEAEQPFGSVITTTQPKAVRELISRADDASGFANRWVYATGVEKPQLAINRVKVDLIRPIALLKLISNSARTPEVVTWSPEAEKLWTDFFDSTIVTFRKRNKDAEITQRIDLLLKKLFLIFTINNKEKIVTESTVNSVLAIYPYLMETYQIIDEEISASADSDNQDVILRHISRLTSGKRGPTARELHKIVQRRVPKVSVLRKMLEDFVTLGIVIENKIPTGTSGGRPTSCFTLAGGHHYSA